MIPVLFGYFGRLQPGVADGLLHGEMIPRSSATQKTQGAAIDCVFGRERGRAVHLAPKTQLRIFLGTRNPGLGLAQACEDLLGVVSDG